MSLVAYYPLSSVNDLSGNGYTLTNTGGVDFTTQGKFGNCANLGAANSTKRLNISNNLGIGAGLCTMLCWVKNLAEIAANSYVYMMVEDVTTDVAYAMAYVYNEGTRTLQAWRVRQGIANDVDAGLQVTLGTTLWHQVGVVYDNTKLYTVLNGRVSAGTAYSGNGNGSTGSSFCIGAEKAGAANFFSSSSICNAKVYNEVLTPQAIRKEYAIGVGKFY